MIPSLDKPKYKPLVRLRTDVYNTLKEKTLKKKKWRPIISFVKKKEFKNKKLKKKTYSIINYRKKSLSRFPVYRKYSYQKELFMRTRIKIIYGRLQDYKIKKISRKSHRSWYDFAQVLEQKTISILYRLKFVPTYGIAKLLQKHKSLLVNGSYKKVQIQKGDLLHFSRDYEKTLRRIICKNYLISKKLKYGINQAVDLDVNSLRFFFLDNLYYFKNHPFKIPFEKLLGWYTRV